VNHQVKELLLEDGDSPFGQWFGSLDAVPAAKVRVAVGRMERGNLSNIEWFRGIGECKINWGPGLRIYLAQGWSEDHHPDWWRHQEASAARHRPSGGAVGNLQAPQGINPTRKVNMALTRDFKETVAARAQNDPAFAQALLDEAITLFVNGEPDSAKLILRDLVNATVGFEALAEEIHKPAKSLHRMLSRSGNPTMSNLSAVFAAIKRALKVEAHTQIVMA